MKLIFILIFIHYFLPADIFGQQDLSGFYNEYLDVKRRDSFLKSVGGSPYFNPEFSDAVVYQIGKNTPSVMKLRYNNCFDEMEMKSDNTEEFLIIKNKETIDSILLYNEKYRYLTFTEKDNLKKGYFIEVYNGKCNLYVKRTIYFQPEKIPASGYDEYIPPSFVQKPELFYVQFENKPLMLLPQSTNRMVNLFKENGYDVGQFIKKNRIKYNAESLFSLFQYCNQ